MAKSINQAAIAEQVGVDKGFVNFVLEGKRNPNTEKGMEVLLAAANQYAEKCKADYIAKALRKWRLAEKLQENTVVPKSKYKGVYWHKQTKKWKSYYKTKHLGYFRSEEQAAEAYQIAKEQAK